jgi:hypothetical protein
MTKAYAIMKRGYEYNDEIYQAPENDELGICQTIYKNKTDAEKAWFDLTYQNLIKYDFTGYTYNDDRLLNIIADLDHPNNGYFTKTVDSWNREHITMNSNLDHKIVHKLIKEIAPFYDPYFIMEVELY